MRVRMAQYGIAHAHASGKVDAMKRSPDVDFCGIFEPDAGIRAERGDDPIYEGLRWFQSKEEMLDDDSIVAVAVEGRHCDNLVFAREAIERDKHIWLDKPAGDDLEEFRRILTMVRKKKLFVQLGYMFRYNSGFRFIFERVSDGSLGDIFSVRGRMSTNAPPEVRAQWGEYPGGVLFELLVHLMDAVVSLLGRPDKVTSFLRNDLGITPELSDNTVAVFEYENAIATVESAAMEVSAFPSRRFEVYGTRGSAILEPLEPTSIRLSLNKQSGTHVDSSGSSVVTEALEPTSVRLCLDEDRGGYAKGWQRVEVAEHLRYDGGLAALDADIRGEKSPDRSLYHELIMQETVLRASRGIEGFLLPDVDDLLK